jgi:hypothetical protein
MGGSLGSSARRRPGANSQHGIGKRRRRFVRQGVACLDGAVLVTTDEHRSVIGRAARLQRIVDAVERHCGDDHLRFRCEPVLQLGKRRIALGQSETEAIAVNDNVDEIRVVEGDRRAVKRRRVKPPAGRPLLPQDPTQVASMPVEAFAPPLGLEEMLIPHHAFEARRERVGRR